MAVKLLDLENLNCSLVGTASCRLPSSTQHRMAKIAKSAFAGRNCQGSANHAAAASSKRAAVALLICPPAESLDGHAIRSWRFCAEPDEICVLRGEHSLAASTKLAPYFSLQNFDQQMTIAGS